MAPKHMIAKCPLKGTAVKISSELLEPPDKQKVMKQKSVRIFVEIDVSQTLTLEVKKDATIRDLKEIICKDYGYLPDRQSLCSSFGMRLDDVMTLENYGINKDSTVQLSLAAQQGSRRVSFSSEASKAQLADTAPVEEEEEGFVAFRPEKSAEDLEMDVRTSLRRALTSGGVHAKELSPAFAVRDQARKVAQQKAATRRSSKESSQSFDSVEFPTTIVEVGEYLFPGMFTRCTPCKVQRGSVGGA